MTVPLPAAGSTWTSWGAQVDAQGRGAQPGPKLHLDYRTKADGPLPTTGDEGVTITNPRNVVAQSYVPTISSGRLVSNIPTAVAGASYVDQSASSKVLRLGALFGFTAGDNDGAIGLVVWATDMPNPAVTVPDAHIHLSIGPTGWHYGVWVSNVFTEISNGTFSPALAQDGTLYRAEVRIDGTTATVVLPDDSANSFTDSRIGSITGIYACWEFFKNTGTSCLPTFAATWADTSAEGHGMTTPTGVAKLAAGSTPYVVVKEWAPGSEVTISPTTSFAAVNSTNLTLNQRAGPTGAILVTMQAWLVSTPTSVLTLWGVAMGVGANAAVGGPDTPLCVNQGTTGTNLVTVSHMRAGLVPGQMCTVQWQHYVITADAGTYMDVKPAYGMYAVLTATPI